MIEARDKFSVEDLKRLKYDTRLLLAERVKPALVEALAAAPAPSEDLAEARRVLEAWDNRASAGSRGTVLFQRFWNTYQGGVRQPYAEPGTRSGRRRRPAALADTSAALKHVADAVKWTRDTYGAADVAWGDANRFRLGDIDLPGEGASGALGAYRVQTFDPLPAGGGNVRVAAGAPPIGNSWAGAMPGCCWCTSRSRCRPGR